MTLPEVYSDNDLLRLTMAGDEDAFTALYRRRQGGVYRFALQMSGCRAFAEDVTQEVFMTLIREAKNYDPARGSLSSYLYGIARNHILRRLDKDRLLVPIDGGVTDDAVATLVAQGDPLGDLTRDEMIEAVRCAVLALPPHYREVVVLCDLHEMSYAEAAMALGCAVGTVRSRLHRARAMLVERLRAINDANSSTHAVGRARCLA